MKKCLSLFLALILLLSAIPALAENDAALPQVGEIIHGFEAKEIRDFPLIGAQIVLFEHQKTGAKLMYVANEDNNRVFQLTFATIADQNARIDNLRLKKSNGSEPVEKKDPQLAFSQDEVTVEEGSDFTPPELQNPFGVAVSYASSNEDVAWVNAQTGAVVLGDPGEVTITASFPGNDLYLPAEASYLLTVTLKLPDGIRQVENGEMKMETSPVYDLQGRKVSESSMLPSLQGGDGGRLPKGVYIVNGKKVIQ